MDNTSDKDGRDIEGIVLRLDHYIEQRRICDEQVELCQAELLEAMHIRGAENVILPDGKRRCKITRRATGVSVAPDKTLDDLDAAGFADLVDRAPRLINSISKKMQEACLGGAVDGLLAFQIGESVRVVKL